MTNDVEKIEEVVKVEEDIEEERTKESKISATYEPLSNELYQLIFT